MHEETNFFVGKKTLNSWVPQGCLCGKALLISLHTEEFSDSYEWKVSPEQICDPVFSCFVTGLLIIVHTLISGHLTLFAGQFLKI